MSNIIIYSHKTPQIWYAAGAIIFNSDFTKTIIVKTQKGNIGFPKGGREKNERVHQTAHREVKEETGLKSFQYKHDNTLIGEKKGNIDNPNIKCSIYYFIAYVEPEVENIKLKCFDPTELSFVEWIPVNEAYNYLGKRRQLILKQAHEYIINKFNTNNTTTNNITTNNTTTTNTDTDKTNNINNEL